MVANIRGFTPNYGFKLINFDTPRWHTLEYSNWSLLDSMFLQLGTPPVRGEWTNSTLYVPGDRTFDADTGELYGCQVEHTSAATGTFAADRLANPTYWSLQLLGVPLFRGAWAPDILYSLGDIVFVNNYEYYLCSTGHTSSATFSLDAPFWQLIFDASDAVSDAQDAATAAEADAATAAAAATSANSSAVAADASKNAALAAAISASNSAAGVAADAASAAGSAVSAADSATAAANSALALWGTSTTSNTIGTGSKTFTTQADKQFNVGNWMTIVDAANPTVNAMSGQITAYSGTTLTVNVGAFVGSGTISNWQLFISGAYGAVGPAGPQGVQGIQGPQGIQGIQGEKGNDGAAGTGTGDMLRAQNLDDVLDKAQSRTNLGLKNSAVRDVGTIAGTVMAGDDVRVTSAAPLASPTFTGDPKAPTAAPGDSDTSIATTAFVAAAVIAGAVPPATVAPLMDGVAAVGVATKYAREDHKHPTDTSLATTAQLALKADLASPTFTGDPKAPTAAPGDNDTSIATTAFVTAAIAAAPTGAPINSPTFTGDPKAPTPAVGDNDTSIATTAYVQGQAATATPLMDGVAAVGTGTKWAREDHKHPTDTALAPLASPTFTGDPKAPTPTAGDSDTSIATTAFVQNAISTSTSNKVDKAGDTMTGDLTVSKATPLIVLDKTASGQAARIQGKLNGVLRWNMNIGNGTTEGGGNSGSDFALSRYNDAGVVIDSPLTITRVDGLMQAIADPTAALGVATKQYVDGKVVTAATAAEFVANTQPNRMLTPGAVWTAAAPFLAAAGAALTPDLAVACDFFWPLNSATGNLGNMSNGKPGQKGIIYIQQDASGNRAITTWGTAYKFSGGTKPTLTTAANAIDAISYHYYSSTLIFCSFISDLK